jgi:hypothetical protein
VADVSVDILADNLVRLLNDMADLQSELTALMQQKIDSVKKADVGALEQVNARELALIGRAVERDGLRRQLMKKILRGLGLEPGATMRLTELAGHFREPVRSRLLVASSGLKAKLKVLERTRVKATLVTEAMLLHLRDVLNVMTRGHSESDVYARTGKPADASSANVFEAVG